MAVGGIVLSHAPQRSCTGCRRVDARTNLVRLVWADGRGVVIDHSRKAAGRGAYVHPRGSCVATMRSGLGRSLRRVVSADDVHGAVAEMSRADDNSGQLSDLNAELGAGHMQVEAVKPARLQAKD